MTKMRYKYWPDHIFGEILEKPWMETAVPWGVLVFTILFFSLQIDNFISPGNLADNFRQASELGFVVLGISLVLIVGGIDLSVASIFAICNLLVLYCMHVWQLPLAGSIGITLTCGALLGSVNGILIGYFRMRAFLTTMVTLIVFKAIHDLINVKVAVPISSNFPDSPLWDTLGYGSVFSVPTAVWAFGIVAIICHIFLTRLRPGWWVLAVGGNRRSAYNIGLPVNRIVALSYVACGVLTAASAIFLCRAAGQPRRRYGQGA